MTRTRQVVIKELPKGALDPSNFALTEADLPAPGEGEALVKTILMSIDAANRAWMQGATYAEVVESRDPSLSPGDVVAVESGWTEYAVIKARKAIKLPPVRPLSNLLSVFGIAGKTAYHGLVQVGRPVAGETVLVSAAAGSVGMYVGQIAKALGCRAVGIAGGAEKCAWVVEALGFDACVDYRDPGFFKALKAACPDGVDVYFDNVGGAILETALFLMNLKGRVVCCGAVSQYDETAPTGPRNLPGLVVVKRLRMEGFIVMDFADKDAEANEKLSGWVQSGRLKVAEDVVEGLENAPAALIGLLKGENRGKRMVRVAPDPA